MDLDADLAPAASRLEPRRPRIVEIVGPPGAGKTSLLTALAAQRPDLRPIFGWRAARWIPSFARDAAGLLPLFIEAWWRRRPLARRDMERMVRVQASRRIAERCRRETLVMDQGPIYTLATLRLSRPAHDAGDPLRTWWDRMSERWARLLHTVVVLDAPDAVLLERIRNRSKDHRLKGGVDRDGLNWLASLRRELDRTVERIGTHAALTTLRFETDCQDLPAVADRICAHLDRAPDPSGAAAGRRGRSAPGVAQEGLG
ncbi:MAG: hypothetical protein JSU66_01250 [Deltaproteobacteria bacterium]|nr:MAG: hypothetical protein JSU66_01250 [Deltaproteobacteria bacterium]